MTNLNEIAQNYLETNQVNWRLGIHLYNELSVVNPELARACLKRSIELKPTLVRRLNLRDDDLKSIAQKHLLIALDDSLNIGTYFKIPTIDSISQLDLQIYSILSNEISRAKEFKKIKKHDRVFGFGSCFAVNFVNYLNKLGINSHSSIISEDVNSPINNLQLLKWIFKNEESQLTNDLKNLNPDIDRKVLLQKFQESDHIILTLGSSFYLTKNEENPTITLKPTGNTKYQFQSIDSIKYSIIEIVDIIKLFNTKVNLIITVSPIPLRGVLDGRNPLVANCASKAALRTAIEELLISKEQCFNYLPIYDAIVGLSPYVNSPTFGTDDGESRHLNGFIINSVMKQISQLIIEK